MSLLAFPTPRPPSRTRRASAADKSSPPPPYVPDLSPSVSNRDLSDVLSSPASHWDDSSREELDGLLSRADGLIRQRERELSFTSEYSRELHNSGRALKQNHQTLLTRLPACTPPFTPISSPQPVSQTPHYYSSGSLPRQGGSQADRLDVPPSNYRRTRRVSVSPAELARLADENQDLLQKFQDLQEESEAADKAGRRRLGKLEKEIAVLRRELEEAHARSTALEEHNVVLRRTNAEATAWKQQREERTNRAREQDLQVAHADFAPSGPAILPASLQRRTVSNTSTAGSSTPRSLFQELPTESATPHYEPVRTPSELSRAASPVRSEVDAREHALVSQLLLKVRELEEANAQIGQSQSDTAAKLEAAQLEAESIRRVYEYLNESADIELQVEDATTAPEPTLSLDSFTFPTADSNVIRFRSLRRTIDGDVRRTASEGIGSDVHSTTRAAATKVPKRKTVVGLFDISDHASHNGSRTVLEVAEDASPSKAPDDGPFSPALSSLRLGDEERSPLMTHHRTLGSELGSDFGDVFTGGSGSGSPFRSASIYGIESLSANSSAPPSPGTKAIELSRGPSAPFPSKLPDEPSTPPNQSGAASMRVRKLSTTIRARTNRWVDHRLQDFQSLRLEPETPTRASPAADTRAVSSAVPPHPALRAVDRMFTIVDATVDRITPLIAPGRSEDAAHDPALADSATVVPSERPLPRKRGLAAVALELWLWMQFAIIVLVFVYAMAKRGPQSILKDADLKRKRAS